MTGLRRALVALGFLGVVAGAVPLGLALVSEGGHQRWLIAVAGPVTGWAFIGTGLWLWWQRPTNALGALMVAVGFSACLASFRVSTDPVVFITGLAFISVPYAVLYHMLLAFPGGMLECAHEKWLTGVGYVSALVVHPFGLMFQDTTAQGLPDNPLLVSAEPVLVAAIGRARASVAVILIVVLAVLLLGRWRQASRPQRRRMLPVLATGGGVLGLLGVWYVANLLGLSGAVPEVLEAGRVAGLALVPFGFVAGLLHGRVAAAGMVSDLVARFGDPFESRHSLRDALAHAFEDPSVSVAYWLADEGRYVDLAGRAVPLPADGDGRTATIVTREGRRVAAIIHAPGVEAERIRAAGAAVGLALENERLQAELRARLEELRASRARIVQAADEERRRIERNLHDGTQQRLTSIAMALGLAESRGATGSDAVIAMGQARRGLATALAELRALSQGIHPAVLTTRGLTAAVEDLALGAALPVTVRSEMTGRLPEPIEAGAYYVVAEALANAVKHARASAVETTLAIGDGALMVTVADDGIGGADPASGSGLRGLRDRTVALGGTFDLSSPPGSGTRLTAVIPCE